MWTIKLFKFGSTAMSLGFYLSLCIFAASAAGVYLHLNERGLDNYLYPLILIFSSMQICYFRVLNSKKAQGKTGNETIKDTPKLDLF